MGSNEENFADMLAASFDAKRADLRAGDKVRGKVIAIDANSVFIDTGSKNDGVADRVEFLTPEGELTIKEGDELDLYVVARNRSELKLSKALAGAGGFDLLHDAYSSQTPVEGKVKETCKGGFSVTIMGRRAFCPVSQIDNRFVENPEEYVGQSLPFLITKLEERGRNIVVSRRKLLEAQAAESVERLIQELKVGDVISGRVTRLASFGAFVEIAPSVEGMVHISELGWARLERTEDGVQSGDMITVKVIGLEQGKKGLKISLSVKQALADPWETASERFSAGQLVSGKVTRCAKFGAFVELEPGIEGMIHVSELSYVKRIFDPEDVVKGGDIVSVKIKEIDIANRRISLSLREADGDPWQEVPEKFPVGGKVQATVEKREKFGLFMTLAPGITGLLPKSKWKDSPDASKIEALRPGETLEVNVDEIDLSKRKITLGVGEAKVEDDWRQFSKKAAPAPAGGLAEKLMEAMARKK